MPRRRVTLPYTINFVFRQDADFTFSWTMRNSNETAINNTGYEFEMEIRTIPNATIIDRFSVASGEVTLGGASGLVTLTVAKNVIKSYTPGTYRYDIRERNGLSRYRYLFEGTLKVAEMITQDEVAP